MSIPETTQDALADAQTLVKMGVPVFACGIDSAGNFKLPSGWERTRPNSRVVERFRSGGLCAVTGIVFDVIDIDPRNGGNRSIQELSAALGERGPDVYWRVKTPSGGLHLWIAALGIGTRPGFMPGLDLKGGKPDGSSRGFVFIPPTVRPSKIDGRAHAYAGTNGGLAVAGTAGGLARCEALATFVEAQDISRHAMTERGGREDPDDLRSEAISAAPGMQRAALLRYVHELERRGYAPGDIVTLTVSLTHDMPVYDERRPWRISDVRGLLHKAGRVIGDATAEEAAEMQEMVPITAGLVRKLSDLSPELIRWLWKGYLAFRELTLLDGEKGQGKSFIIDDIVARASRGDAMPGMDHPIGRPIRSIIFTDEGHLESVSLPRLIAADANMEFVFAPRIEKPKRGKDKSGWELALPDGAATMERMIKESGAEFAIWDPIADFLDESINSHNDASVRRALRPLNGVLNRTGCAGLAIRHLNKDTKQELKFRGSGSTAFQNRARVHLVAGTMPILDTQNKSSFYVGVIDANIIRAEQRVLGYSIIDSEIIADDEGSKVGQVEWAGYLDLTVRDLSQADRRKGPAPVTQDEIIDILNRMFDMQPEWDQRDGMQFLREEGITANKETIIKARKRANIESAQIWNKSGGVDKWIWRRAVKPRISDSPGRRRPVREA